MSDQFTPSFTLREVFMNPLVGLAVVSRLGTLSTICPYLLTHLSIF